jgi:polysaccharide chain length determinant protein (PEP-CTERM system associated)
MQITDKFDIQKYLDIVNKYKWQGLIPACILMLLLFTASFFLPKVYSSTCLVEVDRGAIENPLKAQRERVQNLEENLTVFSENAVKWSVLSQVVDKVGIEPILKNSDKYNLGKIKTIFGLNRKKQRSLQEDYFRKEAVIALLKREINFKQKPPKFLLIEYNGTLSDINAKILNTLVSTLLEERTKGELAEAGQNYEFIKSEMESYRRKLEEAEAGLREFKERHITELPNNMNINLTQLTADKSELLACELELKELTSRIRYINDQLKKHKELVVSEIKRETNPMLTVLNQRIIDMEIELTSLRTNYTELHPRIIELKGRLEDLKKQRDGVEEATMNTETSMLNPVYQQLAQDRQNASLRSEVLKNRIENLKQRIGENEQKVQSMPSQEQQLLTLTRNYEVTANIYNMFLQKLEEARLHEKLVTEENDQESFRAIEYARASLRAISPVRMKLMLLILLTGVGTAAGIVFSLNYLDDSLKTIEEVKEFLGKPLLGTVPSLVERGNNGNAYRNFFKKSKSSHSE